MLLCDAGGDPLGFWQMEPESWNHWGGLGRGRTRRLAGEGSSLSVVSEGGMWAAAVAPVQGSTRERGAGEAQGLHLEASLLPQPHLSRLKDRDGSGGISFLSAT